MDSERTSGIILGAISGVATSINGMDILLTLVIAFVTGALGAAGAHVFKIMMNAVQERRKKSYDK